MTYNDLREGVAALGFESEIENEDAVRHATARALRCIYTERPCYGTLVIGKNKIAPAVGLDRIYHRGGELLRIPLDGARSYSFRTSGIGAFEISDESGTRNFSFSGNDGLHRGFIHGSGELLFKGDYSYTVSNLALYDELFGPSVEDIPIAASHIEYNVKDYVNDFLSFILPPKDSSGRDIKGASVRGSTVSIPCEYEGDVTILYKKAASEPSGAPEEEITVPDGCEHLLPLIVAAYVWLDDDAERSQYYMSLYREGMSAVKYYGRAYVNSEYRDVNGWA